MLDVPFATLNDRPGLRREFQAAEERWKAIRAEYADKTVVEKALIDGASAARRDLEESRITLAAAESAAAHYERVIAAADAEIEQAAQQAGDMARGRAAGAPDPGGERRAQAMSEGAQSRRASAMAGLAGAAAVVEESRSAVTDAERCEAGAAHRLAHRRAEASQAVAMLSVAALIERLAAEARPVIKAIEKYDQARAEALDAGLIEPWRARWSDDNHPARIAGELIGKLFNTKSNQK